MCAALDARRERSRRAMSIRGFYCFLRNRFVVYFFFQAEDGIRDVAVTGVQTCALPILMVAAVAKAHEMLDAPETHALPVLMIGQRHVQLVVLVVAQAPGLVELTKQRCTLLVFGVAARLFDRYAGRRWWLGPRWHRLGCRRARSCRRAGTGERWLCRVLRAGSARHEPTAQGE